MELQTILIGAFYSQVLQVSSGACPQQSRIGHLHEEQANLYHPATLRPWAVILAYHMYKAQSTGSDLRANLSRGNMELGKI